MVDILQVESIIVCSNIELFKHSNKGKIGVPCVKKKKLKKVITGFPVSTK